MPKLSVIISVWNNGKYIAQTVESILAQLFTDFEFIIMDDRGSDNTVEIIQRYDDPRINLVSNPRNMGISASLNRALELAQGEYIAIMDGDDIALRERFSRQVLYLDTHPQVGILGTSAYHIDGDNLLYDCQKQVERDLAIRFHSLIAPPFYHPSCMYRASIIRKHRLRYDAAYKSSLDFHFWSRMLPLCEAANLPEPLICYRIHGGSSSVYDRKLQTREKQQTAQENCTRLLGLPEQDADIARLVELILTRPPASFENMRFMRAQLNRLKTAFRDAHNGKLPYEARSMCTRWLAKAAHPRQKRLHNFLYLLYASISNMVDTVCYLHSSSQMVRWKRQCSGQIPSLLKRYNFTHSPW